MCTVEEESPEIARKKKELRVLQEGNDEMGWACGTCG